MYYTYFYLRDDGTPYYVGKGTLRRATMGQHRVSVPTEENILLEPHLSEQGAFDAERFFISYYGRKDLGTGCLCNLTDGGEGQSNPSDTTRLKMSVAKIGKPSPRKGCVLSAETIQKMKVSLRGRVAWNKGGSNHHEGMKHNVVTRMATCHPDRKHRGSGLCTSCWRKMWRRTEAGQMDVKRDTHRRWHVNRHIVKSDCPFCKESHVIHN